MHARDSGGERQSMASSPHLELLAIPGWDAPSRTVQDWLRQFEAMGVMPRLKKEEGETWILLPSLSSTALVVQESGELEALNFEIPSGVSGVRERLEEAAAALGWELYEEEGGDEDEE